MSRPSESPKKQRLSAQSSTHAEFFGSAFEFRAWLNRNHAKEIAILISFYKKKTGRPGITYQQALDEALCFGWIDGVRKGVDQDSYTIRFSPRKSRSIWSAVAVVLNAHGR